VGSSSFALWPSSGWSIPLPGRDGSVFRSFKASQANLVSSWIKPERSGVVEENNDLIQHQDQINRKDYVDKRGKFELAENHEILMDQDEDDADRGYQILKDQG
jgi:hypothetical protein